MELSEALFQSMREERLMLMEHRSKLRAALQRIVELIDEQDHMPAEALLLHIGNLAEGALRL